MSNTERKRRRRSRHRFSDIPDLTEVLHKNRSSAFIARSQADKGEIGSSTAAEAESLIYGSIDDVDRERSSVPTTCRPEIGATLNLDLLHETSVPVSQSAPKDVDYGVDFHVLREAVMEEVPLINGTSTNGVYPSDDEDHILQEAEGHMSLPTQGNACGLRISNWRVIWSLLRTNGSHKLTKIAYQSVRNLVEAISKINGSSCRSSAFTMNAEMGKHVNGLPHFSTLQRHYRPILMRELATRHCDQLMDVDLSKAGARSAPVSEEGNPQCRVRTVLPSEYARADVGTPPVWSQLKSTSLASHRLNAGTVQHPSLTTAECIDIWPVIAAREWYYGPQTALHLDTQATVPNSSQFAERGDVITVTLLHAPAASPERFQRCFGIDDVASEYKMVRGTILHCWDVHHSSRRGDPSFSDKSHEDLSARDQIIVEKFSFSAYTSPSDSVLTVVPDIPPRTEDTELGELCMENTINAGTRNKPRVSPEVSEALRSRRAALKKRKVEMELAWRNWQKPVLKPGDFITMLRPCMSQDFPSDISDERRDSALLTSVDRCSRICVVSRFWAENEEQDMHLFWISGSGSLDSDESHLPTEDLRLRSYCASLLTQFPYPTHMDVLHIQLAAVHEGHRGPARYNPVSAVGTLISGEDYFIYRFVLYWDGFEVQKGKSATGEGFYLLCLNLPLAARSSPSAVRVLSLTPPGVSAHGVFSSIFADVLEGMTTGFSDYDAEGNRRRIFLDLVAFLGDTPAVNGSLDVLGHTATACCHLCRFVRGATSLVGSRYAGGRSHGMVSHNMRSFFKHSAVRDSGATSETLRLLGIKAHVSPVAKAFFKLRESMFNFRHSIQKTTSGQSVVPHFLDPYRACLVAPDHLLTGHLRDCISLALKLLPSNFYRASCERFMMAYLKDASLPVQNRLVDHKTKSLFSMTMSEIYSLSVVADAAFFAGCQYANSTSHSALLSNKCQDALRLVRSCSNLVSEFWYHPRLRKDGYAAVQRYEGAGGYSNIAHLQRITTIHLNEVVRMFHMTDQDVLTLEDRNCSTQRKLELSKVMRESLIAIKTVDKPNLHRLRELASTTLPLVGYVGRVGELVLEKTHQTLKRSILHSNNREIQLQAMSAAAFSDWQGRLAMVACAAKRGDKNALRCCFRLLSGRDSIASMDGVLNAKQEAQIIQALGPEDCILKELDAQGQFVLSNRAAEGIAIQTWRIDGPSHVATSGDSEMSLRHYRVLDFFRRAHVCDLTGYSIRVGDAVTGTHSNRADGISFCYGDILEVLLYNPTSLQFHFPFLVQPNCMSEVAAWKITTGTSLWCVQAVLSIEPCGGPAKFFAAVLPCVQATSEQESAPRDLRFAKYKVRRDESVSFLRLEESIRRAGVLHDCCGNNCHPAPRSISLSHSANMEPHKGGLFYALTTKHGYPPRRG